MRDCSCTRSAAAASALKVFQRRTSASISPEKNVSSCCSRLSCNSRKPSGKFGRGSPSGSALMLDPRETERRNPRTASIDLASPLEIVDMINAEDRRVPDVVATQREQVARAIELAEATFRGGGRLFY